MQRTLALGLALTVGALFACKKEEPKPESTPAPASATVPTPPPAVTNEPPPAAQPATTNEPSQARTGIPTEGNSKPPTVAEWDGVGEITVRHSTPLACETKLVREWLRVSCRSGNDSKHQIKNVKLTSGMDSGGVPPFTKKGVASIVTRVKKGMEAEYTFDWDSFSRKLKVAWPNGAPAPTIEFDQPPPS